MSDPEWGKVQQFVLIADAIEALHCCKHFLNKIYLKDAAHFECCLSEPNTFLQISANVQMQFI